jgi:type VI protein secretion system component VasK
MQSIWRFLLDTRTLTVIGVAALAGLLLLGADTMKVGLIWVGAVLGLMLLAWLIVWGVRRWRAQRAAQALEKAMSDEADKAVREAADVGRQDEVASRARAHDRGRQAHQDLHAWARPPGLGCLVRAALVCRHRQPRGGQELGRGQVRL